MTAGVGAPSMGRTRPRPRDNGGMVSRARLTLALALLFLLPGARPARADITAFAGLTPTPAVRPVIGLSGGLTLVIVGWEVEYARTSEDEEADEPAPALRTYMGNVFVQNPIPINGLTFYATAGAGFYRETFGTDTPIEDTVTGFGTNVGGGVKIELSGPLHLRLDYRVFSFTGDATHRTPQRFTAGLLLKF